MNRLFKTSITIICTLFAGVLFSQTLMADATYMYPHKITNFVDFRAAALRISSDQTLKGTVILNITNTIDCEDPVTRQKGSVNISTSTKELKIIINGNGNIFTDGNIQIYRSIGNITIRDIKFEDCQQDGTFANGGAICIDSSSDVSIENCNFKNCTATSDGGQANGGAIYVNSSGNIQISKNCSFIDCKATTKGTGVVSSCGGAVYINSSGNFTIRNNCNFTNCMATATVIGEYPNVSVYGGAVYVNSGGKVTITNNCRFTNCTATAAVMKKGIINTRGEAIYLNGNGDVTITNCNFTTPESSKTNTAKKGVYVTGNKSFTQSGNTFAGCALYISE